MKILYKTMGLGLLSACLCLLCAAPASAKVCFVGEENCTGGGSFEDYENPDADGSLCKQEGYTEKSLCQADMTKYIVAYCPYNSNYVMCCGREYSYDACVYPLVADGKCGNRFKCRCDSDKYPYKQQSATICQNTVTGQNYNNSIASGASCVYTGFANGQTSVNAYFTECLCDRGIYPKTEEECLNNGSTTTGNSCTDSNGNTYYAACICGDKFKVISSDCKYGTYITDPLCTQGDVVKAPKCCDCNINTYPYEDMNNEEVETYASCESLEGCTRGSRYKATSCKLGYKIDGGKCVPKECDEILVDYINDRGISSYALYTGDNISGAKNLIVGADIGGYGFNGEKEIQWSHFNNKKVISGTAYAQTITGSDTLTKLVKQQCTETPFLDFAGADDSPDGVYDFTSIGIRSGAEFIGGKLTCTNCSLEGDSIWRVESKATVSLNSDSAFPNYDNLYLEGMSSFEIDGNFTSKGYNFKIYPVCSTGAFGIEITNKRDKIVSIQGKSSSSKAKIEACAITVKGLAEFQNANIYPTTEFTVGSNSNTYSKTFVTLNNSNLYVYQADGPRSTSLKIYSPSAIGYPDSSKERTLSSYKGSNIITQKATYYGIRYAERKHKNDGDKDIKWTDGTIKSASRYFFANRTSCSFWRCKKSHDSLGSRWKIDGYGNTKQEVCNGHDDCDGAQTGKR